MCMEDIDSQSSYNWVHTVHLRGNSSSKSKLIDPCVSVRQIGVEILLSTEHNTKAKFTGFFDIAL